VDMVEDVINKVHRQCQFVGRCSETIKRSRTRNYADFALLEGGDSTRRQC